MSNNDFLLYYRLVCKVTTQVRLTKTCILTTKTNRSTCVRVQTITRWTGPTTSSQTGRITSRISRCQSTASKAAPTRARLTRFTVKTPAWQTTVQTAVCTTTLMRIATRGPTTRFSLKAVSDRTTLMAHSIACKTSEATVITSRSSTQECKTVSDHVCFHLNYVFIYIIYLKILNISLFSFSIFVCPV